LDGVGLVRLASDWVLPPALQILLALLGLALLGRARRLGVALLLAAVLSLAALSLPVASGALMAGLQAHPALTRAEARGAGAGAVVVLSAGRVEEAPEYGGVDVVDAVTLVRLRYGVRLHRATGLPLVVSGGAPGADAPPLAALMARVAVTEYGVEAVWPEPRSRNTWENARYSAELLAGQGVERVLLVTHAWHMPRAMACFRAQGLDPVPAPTAFVSAGWREASDWTPSAGALRTSYWALHEHLGLAWYRLRYGI
jgi:uncharacterized SAM-binding protein YcdF (DUF218 family)